VNPENVIQQSVLLRYPHIKRLTNKYKQMFIRKNYTILLSDIV
jgi:hypothetical protein